MRYLPLTDADRSAMLSVVGAGSVDELFADVPAEARLSAPIAGLPNHASEMAVERHMARLSANNVTAGSVPFFLGAGAYRHHVPATVDHMIQRGEFLTAYTPYQPEIAQGTLQVLFEFQTQVARLFGTDVANASLYDGSTACWEAIAMAGRITKRGKALLSGGLHPHYVETARTMARFTGDVLDTSAPVLTAAPDDDALVARIDGETSCVVVQYPDILGRIPDLAKIAAAAQAQGALLITVVTEPVALGVLQSPGSLGADIVVGEGQSLGVGLQFGGPYLGLFGCREKYLRQIPGRLCGETVDADGKRGFVLTLSTREQHIRREKATSNICTNSGLCALAFSIHLTLLGGSGLADMARLSHLAARKTAAALAQVSGIEVVNSHFFNEFTVALPHDARQIVRDLADRHVLGGVSLGRLYPQEAALANGMVVAATECTTDEDIAALVAALKEVLA
ncbi:glycine dehydrogenase (decarboxylating) alpha subunit [Novosphingobium aromaticivorans DSM 12444]|uniref:Probable glycine dehydrogenase (decarboxylating) subunit 1 n=1 Tax=Novosphingobium aromaticivorans (strain ATCC 700278 / DSM 12444 / CCUG 56034 / CIP 105152 / NBRC 16084 / F199) TaxID=279238 RepID=GCSPA_NOVAD|nr:aminomethyl-transferring glycine dehydrogenase subunit GcvPA [Novosphingobium aromaticivorans]Q2G781.1 RecName: Full=Probable glycine dehydrogenase (decarboxylating) subunit 1; AltName: Full=Glycine cleavage system P-protein subunit 1; AltName: Full=Glycine decarboxylase subunit 1; AltName: Full=Glycine dehydrogenase (aminomethyl-transferring) subunit 1 [Novosphingobium aromaticivorans DSM 12444]ABD26292.1 glycine dehydrogenase (decarboxylating) alpha subunit [Novosphingobium aromaticivorans D